MAAGIIPVSQIAGWPNVPEGAFHAVENALVAAGFPPTIHTEPAGVYVSDIPTAQSAYSAYVGSADELQYWKDKKQTALDTLLLQNFNLVSFIMAGSATPITATQVGNFLATITTNYRTLRNSIAAATTVAQVQAININSGWPANP